MWLAACCYFAICCWMWSFCMRAADLRSETVTEMSIKTVYRQTPSSSSSHLFLVFSSCPLHLDWIILKAIVHQIIKPLIIYSKPCDFLLWNRFSFLCFFECCQAPKTTIKHHPWLVWCMKSVLEPNKSFARGTNWYLQIRCVVWRVEGDF